MKFAKARVFEELPLEFSQMNTSLASVAASRANDIRGVAEVLAAFSPESRADILAKIRVLKASPINAKRAFQIWL